MTLLELYDVIANDSNLHKRLIAAVWRVLGARAFDVAIDAVRLESEETSVTADHARYAQRIKPRIIAMAKDPRELADDAWLIGAVKSILAERVIATADAAVDTGMIAR